MRSSQCVGARHVRLDNGAELTNPVSDELPQSGNSFVTRPLQDNGRLVTVILLKPYSRAKCGRSVLRLLSRSFQGHVKSGCELHVADGSREQFGYSDCNRLAYGH
jgi:hypothetical protein